uniref:alpha/beta fold hydrolase n=1 Tax=Thaumasiovibrio occultus TaxID=1891184 RepID=UPI000B3628AA|nr:alpha/beta fold hydrolase [Thaumasiovibrio occultus]
MLNNRESQFAHFATATLAPFWAQRTETTFPGVDGMALGCVSFTHPNAQKAVIIVNGRVESYWKYQETIYDLFHAGYDVYAYDHRGQGVSPRFHNAASMGYVRHFADYQADLDTFIRTQVQPARYQHCHLLAHSMGGAVALPFVHQHPLRSAVFCAPMFGLNLSAFKQWISYPLMQLLDWLTPSPRYAPKQGPYCDKGFTDNHLTHSQARYRWFRELYAAYPQLQLGGASQRWAAQAAKAMSQCRALQGAGATPTLILQASDETIVSNEAQRAVSDAIDAELVEIVGGKHELLFEQDDKREQVLSTVLAFFEKAEQKQGES